jgi:hypothetical protein
MRGQSLVEFAPVVLLVIVLMFGVIEIGRLALIYTALADGARAGVRYAMVHGGRSSSPSGSGSTTSVESQVTNITDLAGVSGVAVTVSYLSAGGGDPSGNLTGDLVRVQASYVYVPVITMAVFTPLNVTLSSTSQGIVCY